MSRHHTRLTRTISGNLRCQINLFQVLPECTGEASASWICIYCTSLTIISTSNPVPPKPTQQPMHVQHWLKPWQKRWPVFCEMRSSPSTTRDLHPPALIDVSDNQVRVWSFIYLLVCPLFIYFQGCKVTSFPLHCYQTAVHSLSFSLYLYLSLALSLSA